MDESFRIPADDKYLRLLGRAFYNFTTLEWVAVSTIVRLSSEGFDCIPEKATAEKIAATLQKALDETAPPLSTSLRKQLAQFHTRFVRAKRQRNRLLHAHLLTDLFGEQRLGAEPGHVWSVEEVYEVAKLFEEAAIFGNDIFHGQLLKERPDKLRN